MLFSYRTETDSGPDQSMDMHVYIGQPCRNTTSLHIVELDRSRSAPAAMKSIILTLYLETNLLPCLQSSIIGEKLQVLAFRGPSPLRTDGIMESFPIPEARVGDSGHFLSPTKLFVP